MSYKKRDKKVQVVWLTCHNFNSEQFSPDSNKKYIYLDKRLNSFTFSFDMIKHLHQHNIYSAFCTKLLQKIKLVTIHLAVS